MASIFFFVHIKTLCGLPVLHQKYWARREQWVIESTFPPLSYPPCMLDVSLIGVAALYGMRSVDNPWTLEWFTFHHVPLRTLVNLGSMASLPVLGKCTFRMLMTIRWVRQRSSSAAYGHERVYRSWYWSQFNPLTPGGLVLHDEWLPAQLRKTIHMWEEDLNWHTRGPYQPLQSLSSAVLFVELAPAFAYSYSYFKLTFSCHMLLNIVLFSLTDWDAPRDLFIILCRQSSGPIEDFWIVNISCQSSRWVSLRIR